MLAKRLDPIDAYRQRAYPVSPIYKKRLKQRKMSIHARFVAEATEIFPGASILENIPAQRVESPGEARIFGCAPKPPVAEVSRQPVGEGV